MSHCTSWPVPRCMHIHSLFFTAWLIVILQRALQPGTRYVTLSTDDTIIRESYWYASSTLKESCISILQDFLADVALETPEAYHCRCVLRRLVHFYHMMYLSGLFFSSPESDGESFFCLRIVDLILSLEWAHTPDVTTSLGLEGLLSLCNVMELANLLAGDNYTDGALSERERYEIIEARRLCRRITHWIDAYHTVFDPTSAQEVSIQDYVGPAYLARWVLLVKSHIFGARSSRGKTQRQEDKVAFANTINSNESLRQHLSLLGGKVPEGPSWDVFPSLKTTVRASPLTDDSGT